MTFFMVRLTAASPVGFVLGISMLMFVCVCDDICLNCFYCNVYHEVFVFVCACNAHQLKAHVSVLHDCAADERHVSTLKVRRVPVQTSDLAKLSMEH